MIRDLEVRQFKKLRRVKLEGLERVNIFLGNNNVGKTTLLEAVYALASGENLLPIIASSILRETQGVPLYSFLEQLLNSFYNQDSTPLRMEFHAKLHDGARSQSFEHSFHPASIMANLKPRLMGSFGDKQLVAQPTNPMLTNLLGGHVGGNIPNTLIGEWVVKHNGQQACSYNLSYPMIDLSAQNRPPYKLARFIDILDHRNSQENLKIYSYLKREQGDMDEFVKALSSSFDNIVNIDMIPYPDGTNSPISLEVKGQGLRPLYSFGDGVQRWYNILGGMMAYQNAIHCIEEADVTFHPSAQKQLALNLVKYSARFNNQIFMSSHSIEFVDNFLHAIFEAGFSGDMIRIITLRDSEEHGSLKFRVLSGTEAFKSRDSYKLELR